MRPIHKVRLDKIRPAVLLTREVAVPYLNGITVAPITTTIRDIAIEVRVGPGNGLDHDSVVNCDSITTVESDHVLDFIGYLSDADEQQLLAAILSAFAMQVPPRRTGSPL